MKYFNLLLFLTFLLMFSCNSKFEKEIKDNVLYIKNPNKGLWQNRKNDPLVYELEMKFGAEETPEEEILSSIRNVFTDTDENVYIFDGRENRMLAFNVDGELLWVKGRKGEGPGEFSQVRGLAFDGKEFIYFANIAGSRIDQFSLNGEYVKSLSTQNLDVNRFSLEGFMEPNILVLNSFKTGRIGVDLILAELEETLKNRAEIHIKENEGFNIAQNTGLGYDVKVRKDEIVIGHTHLYKIRYYNNRGDLTKVVTRDFDRLIRPSFISNERMQSVSSLSTLEAPFKLQNGYELCKLSFPTNISDPDEYHKLSFENRPKIEKAVILDLFNDEGKLLFSHLGQDTFLPEIGRLLYVDQQGKLYTAVYLPYPHVRRYNLKFKYELGITNK